ncbi:hypothetical protein [Streptomyces sp. NPDC088146]|uniref:hypothetical protein n=1 Tax=Streptomyces sp. NPDC088146 TaxID=3365829 RepID=UPI003823640A
MDSQAEAVLPVETVHKSWLDSAISAASSAPWWERGACTIRARSCSMWQCAVAWGGDCLADVAPLSAEPGVFGPVTRGPTASPPVNTPVSSGKHAPTRDPPGPRPRPRTRLGPGRHCRPDSGGRAAVDLDEVLVILYGCW